MDKQDFIPFSHSCRLCLRRQGFFNVFKIKGLLLDIYEIIGLKMFSSEYLPQMICKQCLNVLSDVKNLRQVASTNEKRMRNLASSAQFNQNQVKIEQICREDNQRDLDRSRENVNAAENHSSSSFKTENAIIEDLSSSGSSPCPTTHNTGSHIPQLTVRSDLFTSPEMESCLDTKISTDWAEINIQKRKPMQIETTYRCETCAKNYATWKKFYFHNRLHNKSIACPLESCGKKFASKGDLEKHYRTHTGDKPYHCELCPRRFAQRGTLKSHREAVHNLINEVIIGT